MRKRRPADRPVWLTISAVALLLGPAAALAETGAPAVHWGALAYPDQSPTLALTGNFNRFTEFNGDGRRFNNIRETMGFNFASITWTEHWRRWEHWSTNLTVGAGPTGNQPTSYLQNEFIHDTVWGIPKVPIGRLREETDFMIDGSLTRWIDLGTWRNGLFAGAGVSTGSLYHEGFARAGFRRAPIGSWVLPTSWEQAIPVLGWLKGFHLSGMVRYGRLYSGAAFREVSPESYLAQGSISWGIYDRADGSPFFEIEIGATIDSGLFADLKGNALEERFWTAAVRIRRFTFETWNDQLNRQDYGPTYGFAISYDFYSALPASLQWR